MLNKTPKSPPVCSSGQCQNEVFLTNTISLTNCFLHYVSLTANNETSEMQNSLKVTYLKSWLVLPVTTCNKSNNTEHGTVVYKGLTINSIKMGAVLA